MSEYISVGSTRNRQFFGVVRSASLGSELLGKLGFMRFQVDRDREATVLCQVVSVDRHNTVHEDGSFGPVIASRGSIPYLSSIGDFEAAVAKPVAQQMDGQAAPLRANPPSGTQIVSLDDATVIQGDDGVTPQHIFNRFAPVEQRFLRYPGSLVGETIYVPIVCKSFHPNDENGWGEARHAIFLGRSGSGKTHLAKAVLACYLSAISTMGAFIPDGKGDIVRPSSVDLNLRAFLEANGRPVTDLRIEDLRLEEKSHFEALLTIEGIKGLVINANTEKWEQLLSLTLAQYTDENGRLVVDGDNALTPERFLETLNGTIRFVYSGSAKTKEERVEAARLLQERSMPQLRPKFASILGRFTQGENINELVTNVLMRGHIYFLDIRSFDSAVNIFILGALYKRFRRRASQLYHQGIYSNAIIYVDEANRFIPQTPDDNHKALASDLIDGIKTTRQYGLAWWFADQRPSSISKDAFSQMGTYFFGRGMNVAADRANMESVLGQEGCNIYDYVVTTGERPFVASGQFVGVGSSESVAVPLVCFSSWQDFVNRNNESLDTQMRTP